LEINSVTIRILQRRYPHTISDKGPRRLDASRFGITINCQGIVADEADGYTFTDVSLRHPRIVPFGSKFLQHERYSSEFKPTPAEPAFIDPPVGHFETEAIDVKPQRILDVGDSEKRNGLPDIRFCIVFDFHQRIFSMQMLRGEPTYSPKAGMRTKPARAY